jgi:hypothetical protein
MSEQADTAAARAKAQLRVRLQAAGIAIAGTLLVLALFIVPSQAPKGLEPPTPEERAAMARAAALAAEEERRRPIVVYTTVGDAPVSAQRPPPAPLPEAAADETYVTY